MDERLFWGTLGPSVFVQIHAHLDHRLQHETYLVIRPSKPTKTLEFIGSKSECHAYVDWYIRNLGLGDQPVIRFNTTAGEACINGVPILKVEQLSFDYRFADHLELMVDAVHRLATAQGALNDL